jgi:NAD(P)H dehydrogenase (quinone)
MLLDYYAAFRSGWAGRPTGDLADLLGRAPMSSLDAVRTEVQSSTMEA